MPIKYELAEPDDSIVEPDDSIVDPDNIETENREGQSGPSIESAREKIKRQKPYLVKQTFVKFKIKENIDTSSITIDE